MIWECIYDRRYGGKFKGFLCCHTWDIEIIYKDEKDTLRIEKNRCVYCGRTEILLLVKHNGRI